MFENVKNAIDAIKSGKMIVVTDNEDRENEGDLICSGELLTEEQITFMAKKGSGLICAPISKNIAKKFNLELMCKDSHDHQNTAFTDSIDARNGISTGISSKDRKITIQVLCNENTNFDDLVKPGHIFPLISKNNGVLERPGHTEASVDLMKLAGLKEVAVICEIMGNDGVMLCGDSLETFVQENNLLKISIEELIEYRKQFLRANSINCIDDNNYKFSKDTFLPTGVGDFRVFCIKENIANVIKEHLILYTSNLNVSESVYMRIHSACATGDIFNSQRCDCNQQLNDSLKIIQENGGIVVYLDQEGRDIGLFNKINAYAHQDDGYNTIEANELLGFKNDMREYQVIKKIVEHFAFKSITIISNNNKKIDALKKLLAIEINVLNIKSKINEHNSKYLFTKKNIMKHSLDLKD